MSIVNSKLANVSVEVEDGNLEKALKKFKKKVKKTGLMIEIFNRQQFKKKSQIKREKKLKAQARNKYRVKKEKELDG